MILEYKIDFRSNSQIYEKIFLNLLNKYSQNGKILKDGYILKFYIEIENTKNFEDFSTEFAQKLPNSIFLYDTEVKVIEEMPEDESIKLEKTKLQLPFCLDCLNSVLDKNSPNYHDIFTQCEICGYGIEGEHRSYEEDIKEIATLIESGVYVQLNTFYGTYTVGKLTKECEDFDFDVVAYDYATVSRYTHAKEYELKALASIEKPFIGLRTNLKFKTDIAEFEDEFFRFKLADDFVLQLLMTRLHSLDIDMIFITKADIKSKKSFSLVEPKEIEPIEVVASSSVVAVVRGERGLPEFPKKAKKIIPPINAFYSVIKEHDLQKRYDNIAGIYLSKEYQNTILVYGKKYGTINYLQLDFEFDSIKGIFDAITSSSNTAQKLVTNYKNKFPELFEKINKIKLEKKKFNIYELWGIVAIVLGFSSSDDVKEASKELEKNSQLFLGDRGPRIDYKLVQKDGKTMLDPLVMIRSAMSFRLAGIDKSTLSFGIVESFAEFISNEADTLNENMDVEAFAYAGSLFHNNRFFAKLVKEVAQNHDVFFNNQLPLDGKNLLYTDDIEVS